MMKPVVANLARITLVAALLLGPYPSAPIVSAYAQIGPIVGTGPLPIVPAAPGAPATYCTGSAASGMSASGTSGSLTANMTGCKTLVVFLYFNGSGAPSGITCTYNSVSMTLMGGSPFGAGTYTSVLYLANPSPGSNAVSCSWTNSAARGAIAALGVTGGVGTVTGIQSSTSSGSLTVASSASSLVVSTVAASAVATISGGTTPIQQPDSGSGAEILSAGYIAGATSTSVAWSQNPTAVSGAAVGFSVN